jgi:hypothetical protein
VLEIKVTLKPAIGTLLVYSPGYEDRQARFTAEESRGWIPFAEPVLCVKAIGGPFEFDIQIMSVEDAWSEIDVAPSLPQTAP